MTQRIIILTRHAKSSWKTNALSDHDRPLNARGRASATAIGHWLKSNGYTPELILSSDAKRTKETTERIVDALSTNPAIEYHSDLYHASPNRITAHFSAHSASPLLLVAHNPGIAIAADALVSDPPDHPRFLDFPTGATLVLEFDDEIGPGKGRVLDFIVPRDLD